MPKEPIDVPDDAQRRKGLKIIRSLCEIGIYNLLSCDIISKHEAAELRSRLRQRYPKHKQVR